MYTYSITQWLAFLILYSFLGWIWECCYVSARKKVWVNRGFLHGPLLPIYGFGAVIVLFAALPCKGNVIACFFAGMTAATVLEYCTGAVMEMLFKVRYWDYSNNRFNLNGHICLFCSLGWGAFSLMLIYGLHEVMEKLVLAVPEVYLTPALYVVLMLTSADFALSCKSAFELRDILVHLEKAGKEMQHLQKRLEVYEAFLADDLQKKLEDWEDERREFAELLQEKKDALSERSEAELQGLAASIREKKEELSEIGMEARENLQRQIRREKEELQQHLRSMSVRVEEEKKIRKNQARLLLGNPGAVSAKYKHALAEIKEDIRAEFRKSR